MIYTRAKNKIRYRHAETPEVSIITRQGRLPWLTIPWWINGILIAFKEAGDYANNWSW